MSEAGFLADIIDNPDDDTPRLVFADWLSDAGQEDRAEFIRVQIHRSRLDESDVRQVPLARREDALLAEHGQRWAGDLASVCESWGFRRGFVEQVEVRDGDGFFAASEEFFRLHPLRELGFRDAIGAGLFHLAADLGRVERAAFEGDLTIDVGEALRSPHWSRLRGLEVKAASAMGDVAAAIADAPWRRGLRTLSLRESSLGVNGLRTLLSGDGLPALERLDLSFNESLGWRGCVLVLTTPALPSLRELMVTSIGITGRHAGRIADAERLPRLTRLDIGYNRLSAGAAVIAASPGLAGLRSLDLSESEMGPPGVAALAWSPHLEALRTLEVSSCGIGPDGLRSLMGGNTVRGLHSVDLGTNLIGPVGAALLVSDENPWALRSLDLRFCDVGDTGVEALSSSPRMAGLHTLILHANGITSAGAKALAASPHLGNLRNLGLKNNRVGEEGAAALADTKALQLLTLELETNTLSPEARRGLLTRYGSGVKFSG